MLYRPAKRGILTLTYTPNKNTHPLGQPTKQNTTMNKTPKQTHNHSNAL